MRRISPLWRIAPKASHARPGCIRRPENAAFNAAGAVLLVGLVLTAGCNAAGLNRAAIQSADPGERILAMRAAAEAQDRQAVPLIVDRLEDEDEAVRLFAILALDRITGRRFGYDYAKPAHLRAEPVRRWREYVRDGLHRAGNQPRAANQQEASQHVDSSERAVSPAGTALP